MSGLDVRVSGLSVHYGDVRALADVDLVVPAGRFLSVTGPSGAGKTSLLMAVAGAVPAAAGTVAVAGERVEGRHQAARLGVTLIPQGNALLSALTGEENVLVPLLASDLEPAQARQRAHDALGTVGLLESGNHLIDELSGGQQQRVAVARALAADPPLTLADEPTSDLDAKNRSVVIAALRALCRRGHTVVMATHDPEAAAQTDGEVALDQGRLTWVRGLGNAAG